MDWTWGLDPYVGEVLALAAAVVLVVVAVWWVGSGLWLLRKGAARAVFILPIALSWGLGLAHKSGPVLFVLVLWLSVELVAPTIRANGPDRRSTPNLVAASAAAAGALACLGAHLLGPLPGAPALLFNGLGILAGFGALLAITLLAFVLWRRRLRSRVWRAATAASVVLAFDALCISPGELTVFLLCIPAVLELGFAAVAATRRGWTPSRRRLAVAAVWLVALAGLVAFSRFNLSLSESRSATVIAACRAYEHDHGHLPKALDDLVPAYLPRVPHADWTTAGDFRYTSGNEPALAYFAPWPLEVVYSFETGRRRVRRGSPEPSTADAPRIPQGPEARLIARTSGPESLRRVSASRGEVTPSQREGVSEESVPELTRG